VVAAATILVNQNYLQVCPNCQNIVLIGLWPESPFPEEQKYVGKWRWYCQTCPYALPIKDGRIVFRKTYTPKEPDDIIGGSGAHVSKAKASSKWIRDAF
jgi:hypothetical protein